MPKREFEGKSVKKAIASACRELKLSSEDLKYKILAHGASGIFGLVRSRKAKILVTLPSDISEPAEPKKDDKKIEEHEEISDVGTRTEQPTGANDKKAADEPISPSQDDADDKERKEEQIDISVRISTGHQFLQKMVDNITSEAEIAHQRDNNRITFDITGGNAALLIGKHGQTLEALQYLTERAMNRSGGQKLRVEVDAAGYQAKRKENLVDQAKRMAQKAIKNYRPVTIGPLSPQDRRVIHLTLKPDQRVRTQSKGKGVIRKLTIYPKKGGKHPSKKR